MTYKQVLALLSLSAVCSGFARADEEPLPKLQLRNLKYMGTGCPIDAEAPLDISIEDNSLRMRLPELLAELGAAIPVVNNRRSCIITLDFAVPTGWSYALESFRFGGFTSNSDGVKTEVILSNFFEGGVTSPRVAYNWNGPLESDFVVQDKIPLASITWSPCGVERRLNLNLQVRASADKKKYPDAQGLITLDSLQLNEFGIVWRKC